MKVTDGLWLTRTGATVRPSVEIAEAQLNEQTGEIKLLVATKHVADRGGTLNSPLITVTLSSPTEDVIKVKAVHFAGVKPLGPDFELFPDGAPAPPKVDLSQTDETATLKSGGLEVRVNKKPYSFALDFIRKDGSGKDVVVTSSGYKSINSLSLPPSITAQTASATSVLAFQPFAPAAGSAPGFSNYMQSELSLVVGELIYGLGELFGPMVKNGQAVSIWNQDGGTSSQQGYKTIPFYLSNRGYGVFINEPGEVELEVGSEKGSRVGAVVRGESIEYYIINGPSMKEVLTRYTAITGRPGLPPSWTFGLWLSTSFTTDYSENTVLEFLEGMKTRNCPVRTFHMDCFWMRQYRWSDFVFDPENFPDPKGQITKMKEQYGVKVCVWINSYIAQASELFDEGMKGGFLVKRTNGDVWQTNLWQAGMGLVDFTNPAACEWFTSKLETLLDLGVDSFKTDFGERIPHLDVVYHNGEDPYKVHNWYTHKYNQIVFKLLERRFGKHEAVLFSRSATAGGQRFPVGWGGDCESSLEAMAESLRGGLSLTMSGFSFWSHDIGGFEGTPPPAVFNRWLAFGLFSSHSRLHGSNSYRVPWIYGEDCADNLAVFIEAKHRLMPYLYAAAIASHKTGIPIMRAMVLEFQNDLTCHNLDKQYMFGDSLLVAPVFHESTADYYIPEGVWTSFWDSSKTITGPRWVHEENVAFDTIPVFVRPNSVLPLGPKGSLKPDYDYTSGLTLQAYQLAEGAVHEVKLPSGKGPEIAATLKVSKGSSEGEALKVEVVEGKLAGDVKSLAF